MVSMGIFDDRGHGWLVFTLDEGELAGSTSTIGLASWWGSLGRLGRLPAFCLDVQ